MFNINGNIKDYGIYRVPLLYPKDLLKFYSNKIFEPNKLYLQHENKEYEEFFNIVFSDEGLSKINSFRYGSDFNNYFKKYNILIKQHFEIVYPNDTFNINQSMNDDMLLTRGDKLNFYNNDLFHFENEINLIIFNNFSDESIKDIFYSFKQLYIKEEDVINILKNPEYIIEKTKNKIENIIHYILVNSCIIGSFIYNKNSYFIILLLVKILNYIIDVYYYDGTLRFNGTLDISDYDNYYDNEEVFRVPDYCLSTLMSVENIDFRKLFFFGIN